MSGPGARRRASEEPSGGPPLRLSAAQLRDHLWFEDATVRRLVPIGNTREAGDPGLAAVIRAAAGASKAGRHHAMGAPLEERES
jgi:hypothetical protein